MASGAGQVGDDDKVNDILQSFNALNAAQRARLLQRLDSRGTGQSGQSGAFAPQESTTHGVEVGMAGNSGLLESDSLHEVSSASASEDLIFPDPNSSSGHGSAEVIALGSGAESDTGSDPELIDLADAESDPESNGVLILEAGSDSDSAPLSDSFIDVEAELNARSDPEPTSFTAPEDDRESDLALVSESIVLLNEDAYGKLAVVVATEPSPNPDQAPVSEHTVVPDAEPRASSDPESAGRSILDLHTESASDTASASLIDAYPDRTSSEAQLAEASSESASTSDSASAASRNEFQYENTAQLRNRMPDHVKDERNHAYYGKIRVIRELIHLAGKFEEVGATFTHGERYFDIVDRVDTLTVHLVSLEAIDRLVKIIDDNWSLKPASVSLSDTFLDGLQSTIAHKKYVHEWFLQQPTKRLSTLYYDNQRHHRCITKLEEVYMVLNGLRRMSGY